LSTLSASGIELAYLVQSVSEASFLFGKIKLVESDGGDNVARNDRLEGLVSFDRCVLVESVEVSLADKRIDDVGPRV
jgi:hypothetical protein